MADSPEITAATPDKQINMKIPGATADGIAEYAAYLGITFAAATRLVLRAGVQATRESMLEERYKEQATQRKLRNK